METSVLALAAYAVFLYSSDSTMLSHGSEMLLEYPHVCSAYSIRFSAAFLIRLFDMTR